jgi:hypothetical protein
VSATTTSTPACRSVATASVAAGFGRQEIHLRSRARFDRGVGRDQREEADGHRPDSAQRDGMHPGEGLALGVAGVGGEPEELRFGDALLQHLGPKSKSWLPKTA